MLVHLTEPDIAHVLNEQGLINGCFKLGGYIARKNPQLLKLPATNSDANFRPDECLTASFSRPTFNDKNRL